MEESTAGYAFIKAQQENLRQDRNYQRLIMDCHECVKFLNKLPMGVLEESLQVFRQSIFSMADRKQIPTAIYKILEAELAAEQGNSELREIMN